MSMLITITRPHRHNGKTYRPGDTLRVPNSAALAMCKTGRANKLHGRDLVEEKIMRGEDPDSRKVKAKKKAEAKANKVSKADKGK
jgi:hypothetical protein